jgi:hypothetical protein
LYLFTQLGLGVLGSSLGVSEAQNYNTWRHFNQHLTARQVLALFGDVWSKRMCITIKKFDILRLPSRQSASPPEMTKDLPEGLKSQQSTVSTFRNFRTSFMKCDVYHTEINVQAGGVANLNAYTDGEEIHSGPPLIVHRVIFLDEVAVERRARWDDKTSTSLGACREHGANISLEFGVTEDATRGTCDCRGSVTKEEEQDATSTIQCSKNSPDFRPVSSQLCGTRCSEERLGMSVMWRGKRRRTWN